MIGSGLIGAVITGIVCDKTKKFEEVAKTFYAFAVVAGCLFSMVSKVIATVGPEQTILQKLKYFEYAKQSHCPKALNYRRGVADCHSRHTGMFVFCLPG